VRQRNAVDVYEHGQYGGANVSHQDESHHDEANMHQYDDIESESYDCSTDPISPVHLLVRTGLTMFAFVFVNFWCIINMNIE